MTNKKLCIIHPGAAHRDECLAMGLALAADVINVNTPVQRREPTTDDLNDREILVLDVGGRHEPELANFDHHQLPRGTRECALSLLAQSLMIPGQDISYHQLFADRPWYRATVTIDSLGPFAMAKELGLEALPPELMSPFDMAITDAVKESVEVPMWVKELCSLVMIDRTKSAIDLRERTVWLRGHAETVTLPGGAVALVVPDDVVMGVNDYRDELVAEGVDVAVSVSHDDRGAGWSLYRFDDDRRVNFSRLDGDPAVLFAHAGGFIAKTKVRLAVDDVVRLVTKAMA